MLGLTLSKLKQINNILSLLLIALALYIAFSPLVPYALLAMNRPKTTEQSYVYQSEAAKNAGLGRDAIERLRPIPVENRLVIPAIGVDTEIFEGTNESTLNKGPWHRPGTGTPDQGNMVISAHRYLYTSGPKTFFYLDKINEGDDIVVFWQGKEFDYKVSKSFVVAPTQISVEAPTKERMLTLYTCTPLWTATNRLVVQATPVEIAQTQGETN